MAKRALDTREIPAQTARAALEPSSVNEEKRTVDVTWTTGARVKRGYYDQFYEELSLDPAHVRMERLNGGGAPFLTDHDGYRVADTPGVVESASLKGGQGRATIRFDTAANDPQAEKLFQKIKSGIVRSVSVGYKIHKMELVEKTSDGIPVYRAVDWEPYEISAVAMPADPGAGFRSEDRAVPSNLCTFDTRGMPQEESRTMEKTPEQIAAEKKAAEEKRQADLKAVVDAAVEADRVRGAEIERHARMLGDAGKGFGEKLIKEGVALPEARKAILDELAKRGEETATDGTLRATVGEEHRTKTVNGATAWLLQKLGYRQLVQDAQDKKLVPKIDLDPGQFRGMTAVDLARVCLEERGVSLRGVSTEDMVGRALTHRDGGYNATSDFAILLENVMHKVLQAGYATQPDTWSRFCAVGSVTDFRPHNRYRLGSLSVLDGLNEAGEYKNKSIGDGEKSVISATTKGNIISLTRQAIISDDLGQFADLAARLGRAAKRSIEVDVYALLAQNSGLGPTIAADGLPLFDASRKNVNATGSALSVAGLDADRVVLAIQTDPSGNEILDLRPAILLIPIGLGGQARVINGSQFDVDNVGAVQNKFQQPNKVVGLFRDIVDSPRLSASTTRRYLFVDPGVVPVFEVAFLNGVQEPIMEQKLGWRVDGTEWRVRIDYGVAAIDARGAVTNAGV